MAAPVRYLINRILGTALLGLLAAFGWCSFAENTSPQFADPSFYLIDSLDLNKVDPADLALIDSMLQLYHAAKTDSTRSSLLANLIEECNDGEVWSQYNVLLLQDALQQVIREDRTATEKRFYQKQLAVSYNNAGYYMDFLGLIDSAIHLYQRSLNIYEKLGDKVGQATSLNNIGLVHKNRGDIEQALIYYHQSLTLLEELGDSTNLAYSLINIGNIYREQNDVQNAIQRYEKALLILEKMGNQKGYMAALINLAKVYTNQGDLEKAKTILAQCEAMPVLQTHQHYQAVVYQNLGWIAAQQQEVAKAKSYYQRSKEIREATGDKYGMANGLRALGELDLNEGNVKAAKAKALQSMELAEALGFPVTIRDVAKLLRDIAVEEKDWKNATRYAEIMIEMRDSVVNEENQKSALKQQMQYAYEKEKLSRQKEQEKKDAIAAKEKERQNIVIGGVSTGLFIVLLFAMFLYNRFRVIHKQKQVIETQKEAVEEQKAIVDQRNKEITDSINYAQRIQKAILPPTPTFDAQLPDNFILYQPKAIVAGDFYWMHTVGDSVLFAVADCTGHGVPGAMVSIVCHNALNRAVREYMLSKPAQILEKVRELVIDTFQESETAVKDGMDIALCRLHKKTFELTYAGANNPLYLVRKPVGNKDMTLEEIKADRQPIGPYPKQLPFTDHQVQLSKGDQLYLFSDGFADQFGGPKGRKFKYQSFRELILEGARQPMAEQKTALMEAYNTWKSGYQQIDDVCVIGVKV